jgi:hypothetical protein
MVLPDLANDCFGSLANLVSRGGEYDVGSSAPAQHYSGDREDMELIVHCGK